MQMSRLNRLLVAGMAAAGMFLGADVGLLLVWWLAGLLSLGVFVALRLIIADRPPAVGAWSTEADLQVGIDALTAAPAQMLQLATRASEIDRAEFKKMAALFDAIRTHHSSDPKDYRHTRRFIRHDLPRIVDTSAKYLDLSDKASGDNRARADALGQRIRGFTPVLEKIDQACLDNDFLAPEVQVEVLSEQLKSR